MRKQANNNLIEQLDEEVISVPTPATSINTFDKTPSKSNVTSQAEALDNTGSTKSNKTNDGTSVLSIM
eukprot:11416722-Ditylum_brightwellii.AAC.1